MQSQGAVSLQLAILQDVQDMARMSALQVEYGLPPTWTARRIHAHVRHRECTALVATVAGTMVGFAIMDFGSTTAHLNLLAVKQQFQRRGIGRQLIDWLHTSAMTVGTFIINLELRAENIKALRFYTAMGYSECGYV